jgi:hypothetical protein
MLRPERKYSRELLPARRVRATPMASEIPRKATTIAQSRSWSRIAGSYLA